MFRIATVVEPGSERRRQMRQKFELQGKNILNLIKFKALYLLVQVKISLLGCLFVRVKNLRSYLFLLLGFVMLASPAAIRAQQPDGLGGSRERIFRSQILPKTIFCHPLPLAMDSIFSTLWFGQRRRLPVLTSTEQGLPKTESW